MSKQRFLKRYSLIINFLRRTPSSFNDIEKYLQQQSILEEENFEVALRTFQRDILDIESIFGIIIRKNRAKGVYEIEGNSDENEDKYDRLMESFEVYNALKISNNFSEAIIVERRKPLGLNHMHTLLQAIKKKSEIQFTHEKYWSNDGIMQLKNVQPIALKEARFRWYLIAKDNNDNKIKTFGLERISDLIVLNKTFENNFNYDVKSAFKHSFGIITQENELPQKVVLSFSHNQSKFIKSFPLHHSQTIIIDNKNEFRIELLILATYDFVMEIMSIGSQVKVLEPLNLKEEIKSKFKEALKLYES